MPEGEFLLGIGSGDGGQCGHGHHRYDLDCRREDGTDEKKQVNRAIFSGSSPDLG
jgi:hypothetical protein